MTTATGGRCTHAKNRYERDEWCPYLLPINDDDVASCPRRHATHGGQRSDESGILGRRLAPALSAHLALTDLSNGRQRRDRCHRRKDDEADESERAPVAVVETAAAGGGPRIGEGRCRALCLPRRSFPHSENVSDVA